MKSYAMFIYVFAFCSVSRSFRPLSRSLGQYKVLNSRLQHMKIQHQVRLAMSTTNEGANITLKEKLATDMKDAMKSKQKNRLAAIRAIQTAIKQKVVDERIDVNDEATIAIMSKLVKQRKESIKSYSDAGRADLAQIEQEEVDVINSYLPQQMTIEEIDGMINEAVTRLAATTLKDMGKIMNELRPKLAGKADMAEVGNLIKKKLGGK